MNSKWVFRRGLIEEPHFKEALGFNQLEIIPSRRKTIGEIGWEHWVE